jgi:hypothetical protein
MNGTWVGKHEGGYTPFEFDITAIVAGSNELEVVVGADDDPHDLVPANKPASGRRCGSSSCRHPATPISHGARCGAKPRGKQDWQLEPHSICKVIGLIQE